MASHPPTPESIPPCGVSVADHSGKGNKYRGGCYRGKQLERVSPRDLDANLGKGCSPTPPMRWPSIEKLRPAGRTWRELLHQHKLEKRFKYAPYGANLGLALDFKKKIMVPYKKDHFTGAIRPRIMMDDFFDGLSKPRLEFERQMRQRRKGHLEELQLKSIDKEVNGETPKRESVFKPLSEMTSSDFEDWDSDSSPPQTTGKESPHHVEPNEVKVKEEPQTPGPASTWPVSSPLSELSEISEEE
ncbi:hypothetical protein F5Y13DRAFT_154319 [Hypoxylon sp. FL1857]|nr:hypothetical protein F5Y13DRAFT_154319 [Hypoxylon sp. FL1857]